MKSLIPKTKKARIIALITVLLFAVVGAFFILRIFAASARIELVADKTNVKKDETFSVDVMIRSGGEAVTYAAAQLTFDPTKLSYVSTDYSTSTLADNAGPDNLVGSSYVKVSGISKYAFQQGAEFPAGDVKLARVTFKVLADSSTVSVGVDTAQSEVRTYESYVPGSLETPNSLTSTTGVTLTVGEVQTPTDTPAQFVLSASTSTVKKGDTFDVTVGIDSHGKPVVMAHAYIEFDPTKVSYVSTTYDGVSSFVANGPENGSGDGYVGLARYSFGDQPLPSSNIVLGKVTFTALVDSGVLNFTAKIPPSYIGSGLTAQDVLDSANSLAITIASTPPVSPEEPDPTPDPTPNPNPVPVTPAPAPTPVKQGTAVKPTSPSRTTTGRPVQRNDYYVNNNYVGTNNPGSDEVVVDTSQLAPGEYEITTRSTADDGTVEESKQKFTVLAASIFSRLSMPVVIVSSVSMIVIAIFAFKLFYKRAVPFYKTVH